MSVRAVVLSAVIGLISLFSIRPAAAQDPNNVFRGKIMVSSKKFPSSSKSADAYIASVRKQSSSQFFEDKATHTWTLYLAGFLKTPLDDVEYVVKVYELTGKSQQMLTNIDQYTDLRGEKTINTKITLDKDQVGVNKQLLVTMESKGKVLASAQLKILGEGEHFSGKVNFSDDDKDDDSKK